MANINNVVDMSNARKVRLVEHEVAFLHPDLPLPLEAFSNHIIYFMSCTVEGTRASRIQVCGF